MRRALAHLLSDFFSTIIYVLALVLTDNVALAVGLAVAAALGQLAWSLARKQAVSTMQWMSLGLVVVLGGASVALNDPRFMMTKPSIVHFAIAAVMLKPGWMNRYVPDRIRSAVTEAALVRWGYLWAALMAVMGVANLFVAAQGDEKIWLAFVAGIGFGKLGFLLLQIVVMRVASARRQKF